MGALFNHFHSDLSIQLLRRRSALQFQIWPLQEQTLGDGFDLHYTNLLGSWWVVFDAGGSTGSILCWGFGCIHWLGSRVGFSGGMRGGACVRRPKCAMVGHVLISLQHHVYCASAAKRI